VIPLDLMKLDAWLRAISPNRSLSGRSSYVRSTRYWETAMAYHDGIRDGIPRWHTALAYRVGIQRWYTALAYSVGIQRWQIHL